MSRTSAGRLPTRRRLSTCPTSATKVQQPGPRAHWLLVAQRLYRIYAHRAPRRAESRRQGDSRDREYRCGDHYRIAGTRLIYDTGQHSGTGESQRQPHQSARRDQTCRFG